MGSQDTRDWKDKPELTYTRAQADALVDAEKARHKRKAKQEWDKKLGRRLAILLILLTPIMAYLVAELGKRGGW